MRDSFEAALQGHFEQPLLMAVMQAAADTEPMADELAMRLAFGGRDTTGRTLGA
jgi:hypothetical protein